MSTIPPSRSAPANKSVFGMVGMAGAAVGRPEDVNSRCPHPWTPLDPRALHATSVNRRGWKTT
ncbi:hypothetical protein N7517_010958 [Penicillium concentricum]|uniref:Uncharacterized protein n=1 Tax=Penicillium concentricum TaxID=293559 RepID=A0A9W9UTT8_9EURO|nr:uncharacterized protein N7517_010958 [Penicillium concentricum]KAJ5356349.1 hypothetical protein N7517_010958 [Penicillium concentricum]